MSDQDWRALERQWRADPGDGDALERAILARRRAGVPVPGAFLARRVQPARRFESRLPLEVHVQDLDGRPRAIGRTPGSFELPEHRSFWVQPDPPTDAALPVVVAEMLARRIPGLALRPDVSDAGVALLEPLEGLDRLDLSGCASVTDAGLATVAAKTDLEWLDLWCCYRLGGKGVARLGALERLTTLNLRGVRELRDADLGFLERLPNLHALSVGSCAALGDGALPRIAGAKGLAALDLSGLGRLTGAKLASLEPLRELTLLNLSLCPVLEPESLAALAALPNLATLYLVGSGKATALGARRLEALLPRCTVVTTAGR